MIIAKRNFPIILLLSKISKNTFGLWDDKMRRFAIIIVLFLLPTRTLAETHYASNYGSDEYPYTSWATAATIIQNAINASNTGDTVRVGAGAYVEHLSLVPGIALIGAGMDSCLIIACGTVIQKTDSCTIEGFHLKGSSSGDNCIGIFLGSQSKISNNKISLFTVGIQSDAISNSEISNNIFVNNWQHIYPHSSRWLTIKGNTFIGGSEVIWTTGFFRTIFVKNFVIGTTEAIHGDGVDSVYIENNLFVIENSYGGIFLSNPTHSSYFDVPIRNNTFIGDINHSAIWISGFSNEIKNNIICGAGSGVVASGYCVYVGGYPVDCFWGNPQVSYNALWNNTNNYLKYYSSNVDTSIGGNIYDDPMFVGGDDYHLQYGSPCIDAGDPNIKDPDSSRSDIGCYGGTYGETYTYLDYQPKPPDSLSAVSESTVTILSWKPNTESDLSHYLVYKDTIAGFIPDTFKIVGNIPKDSSIFRDYDFVLGKTYYYRVSAWDLTGHQSEYSDELEVQATSVDQYTEEGPPLPKMFQLKQNYPNPFNPSTTIVYYLPDVGYQPAEVEIIIYNLLGQRVRTLLKERKYPGKHQVTWDGKDNEGNDLASGIYFYRLIISGTDLYPLVKPKKMVLIK
jgi:parallel beta-helix repeat protein